MKPHNYPMIIVLASQIIFTKSEENTLACKGYKIEKKVAEGSYAKVIGSMPNMYGLFRIYIDPNSNLGNINRN